MYTVDTNIPLPTGGKLSEWLKLLSKGDSFAVATVKEVSALRSAQKNARVKITSRKQEKGYRVWITDSRHWDHGPDADLSEVGDVLGTDGEC